MSEADSRSLLTWRGLLTACGGVALLAYYLNFLRPAPWMSPFGRLLVVTTSIVMLGWGLVEQVRSLRRAARPELPVHHRNLEDRPAWLRLSWVGILLCLFGVELLFMARKFADPLTRGCLAAAAAAGLFFGLREIGKRLFAGTELALVRHRFALPVQGAVYVGMMMVLFFGSLLSRSNMLMLVFSMLAAPFMLNGAIIVSMLKRLSLTRVLPKAVLAGETFTVEVIVENRKRLLTSTLLALTDRVANNRETLHPRVLVARVAAGERHVARYHLALSDRGRYQFGPLSVETRFPLGLVERGITVELKDEVLVYPRIGRLTTAWRREHGVADELVHRSDTRRGVFDDEFHRLREYRPGDNPKGIHWRTSARNTQLMVREYHQSRNQDLIVLLDLWQPAHPSDADRDRVELAVSFAATVSRDQMQRSRDSRLVLAAAGERLSEWEGVSGPAGLENLMSLLATLKAGIEPNLDQLLTWAKVRRKPATRMLLVSSRRRQRGTIPEWDQIRTGNEFGRELRIVSADPEELARWMWLES